jgi:hypothetical protein
MFDHLVRLFVPHHSNNHRSRILHLNSLISLIGLLLVVQGGVSLLRRTAPDVLGFASNISPQEVINLTNEERAKYNLPPLTADERLSDAARRKVADMYANNYWAHVSPSGTKPWSFILAAGYNYLHAGENLARDFTNARTAMDAWMASPTPWTCSPRDSPRGRSGSPRRSGAGCQKARPGDSRRRPARGGGVRPRQRPRALALAVRARPGDQRWAPLHPAGP